MGTNRLPSDRQMSLWQEEGLLLCNCRWPVPEPVWGEKQCRTCGKLILGRTGVELLRRRRELVEQGKLR